MVDGINNNAIGWSNTRDLYNGVKGDKNRFIKIFTDTTTHKEGTPQAELEAHAAIVYDYLSSMDKDGKQGLTREEYAEGLKEKLEIATEKYKKLKNEYITTIDINNFKNMSDVEKLNYIQKSLEEKKLNEQEAKIKASEILAEINQLDQELSLVKAEIDTIKTPEEKDDSLKPFKEMKNKQPKKGPWGSGFKNHEEWKPLKEREESKWHS